MGALIMDLSKAFDTLFTNNDPLSFAPSCLNNRFQICKIQNSFSSWCKITTGISQDSRYLSRF